MATICRSHFGACALLCLATALLSGPTLADVELGVWEGSGVCGGNRHFYRLSIEPGEKGLRSVFDRLDSPGGRAVARQTNIVVDRTARDPAAEAPVELRINHGATKAGWWIRDLNEPDVPPYLILSADSQTVTERPDRKQYCTDFQLNRVSSPLVSGGAANAHELPQRMTGTWYCNQPMGRVDIAINDAQENSFEGVLTLGPHPTQPAGETGAMSFLGEFDPATGTLTMIGDQWSESSGRAPEVFDMTVTLRDGGSRGVGIRSTPQCRTVELTVDGHQLISGISPAATATPISEWQDPSACMSLVHWASQAVSEAGVDSLHTNLTVGKVREIGIGLLVDERFVPFFGKSYEDLDAAEKAHLWSLGDYCTRMRAFETPMRHSGAAQYTNDFFPRVDGRSPARAGIATVGPRVRLLKNRLESEMAELAVQPVTEADIQPLTGRLAQVEERFSDLWSIDRKPAIDLINDKLDEARGDLERRIASEIEALPIELSAYYQSLDVASSIGLLKGDPERHARLQSALNDRLSFIADELLNNLAAKHSNDAPDLPALGRFVDDLNHLWPTIKDYARPSGAGAEKLVTLAETLASGGYQGFAEQANRVMASAEGFLEREQAYRTVVYLHATYTPNAAILSELFVDYHDLVRSMIPVPTLADLVDEDGGPSVLGIKLAAADFVSGYLREVSVVFPYDIFGFAASIRVAAASKEGCSNAGENSYWCDFRLRVTGNLPMAGLLSNIPSRARFQLRGNEWAIVETPPSSGPTGTAGASEVPCGLPLGCTAGEIGANGILAGLW